MIEAKIKFYKNCIEEIFEEVYSKYVGNVEKEEELFLLEEYYEDFLARDNELRDVIYSGKKRAMSFLKREEEEGFYNPYINYFIMKMFK